MNSDDRDTLLRIGHKHLANCVNQYLARVGENYGEGTLPERVENGNELLSCKRR